MVNCVRRRTRPSRSTAAPGCSYDRPYLARLRSAPLGSRLPPTFSSDDDAPATRTRPLRPHLRRWQSRSKTWDPPTGRTCIRDLTEPASAEDATPGVLSGQREDPPARLHLALSRRSWGTCSRSATPRDASELRGADHRPRSVNATVSSTTGKDIEENRDQRGDHAHHAEACDEAGPNGSRLLGPPVGEMHAADRQNDGSAGHQDAKPEGAEAGVRVVDHRRPEQCRPTCP